jgi:hypothetical protein
MLLNKLESGFLLLHTPQGPVAVEPSTFWERVYLLWTFRNFRELSPLLLNPHQMALMNKLYAEHALEIRGEVDPRLQIGVVEDFVPSASGRADAPAAKIVAMPAAKTWLPDLPEELDDVPVELPLSVSTAVKFDVPPAAEEEMAEEESAATEPAELTPRFVRDRSFGSIASGSRPASAHLQMKELLASRTFRFAAASGAVLLCVCSVVAGYRFMAGSGAHARNVPAQANAPDSPNAPTPAPMAANPAPAPEEPAVAAADPEADAKPAPGVTVDGVTDQEAEAKPAADAPVESAPDPEAAARPAPRVHADAVDPGAKAKPAPGVRAQATHDVEDTGKPSSEKIAPPVALTRRVMTGQRAPRRSSARVARSSGGYDPAALSRVPTAISSRDSTLPAGSHAAMERSAQGYFVLARRQMRAGNYAAARANYRRAWQIEETIAAAKGRQARARMLAMQAKNETIADRRSTCAQSWTTQGCAASSIPNR